MKTNSVYMLYALNPLLLIAIQWIFPFILTTIIVKYSNNLNINQHNTLNITQNDSKILCTLPVFLGKLFLPFH